jgi:hypothetical protein
MEQTAITACAPPGASTAIKAGVPPGVSAPIARMKKRVYVALAILSLLVALLTAAGYGYYRYLFPYGYTHSCDKILAYSLRDYADRHNGWYPKGEATPEASLSLLYRDDSGLGMTLCGKTVPDSVVLPILQRGELLSPETCGWHYVEGLHWKDDPKLALFWDKIGASAIMANVWTWVGTMSAWSVGISITSPAMSGKRFSTSRSS